LAQSSKTPNELWVDVTRKYFPTFKEFYGTEQEMLEYGLGFQQIYGSFEEAFYEFFSLSEFCLSLRTIKDDFVKLVMITSIIEKLNSKQPYITFSQWLSQRKKGSELENEHINKIWNEYNKIYGCSGKFRTYFQKYLNQKEQIELLTTLLISDTVNGNLEFVPFLCYDKKTCSQFVTHCKIGHVFANCPAFNNKKLVKDGIREFAEFLYNLRNKFVHDAHIFHLTELCFGEPAWLFTYIPYEFKYIKRPSYSGMVVLRLTVTDLENKLLRDFKKLLSSFIGIRKQYLNRTAIS
jgi:hypothetical protein